MADSLSARLLRLVGRTARKRLARTTRRPTADLRHPDSGIPTADRRHPDGEYANQTAPAPRRGSQRAGPVEISYAPRADGRPDPGEVVWTWVPYEEDPTQGKDRPVLVIGRREGLPGQLVGLMLTSKDHDRDVAQQARLGRHWMDIGTGGWDARHRPSEVRLDRLIEVDAHDVRREGAALDRPIFDRVVAAARTHHG